MQTQPRKLLQSVRAQARGVYWNAVCALVSRRTSNRVWSGPFAGTKYKIGAVHSASVPKLIGTYERELQPEFEKLATQRWSAVIDVGAAEGYYAIGFARRLPGTKVLAFEMDPLGRELLNANARENSVSDSIELREECTPEIFASVLESATAPVLVIMDVEGAEATLIGAAPSAALARGTFVIEVHDFASPANGPLISERLRQLLGGTHSIQIVRTERRSLQDFPSVFWFVPPRNRLHAMDEYRPTTMEWMICRPKQ